MVERKGLLRDSAAESSSDRRPDRRIANGVAATRVGLTRQIFPGYDNLRQFVGSGKVCH